MSIITSKLTAGSNNHLTTSEEANGVYTDFVGQGIVGAVANASGVSPSTGGWAVNAQGSPDATVAVGTGVAYVTGTPTSQNSQTFRVKNGASANVTIAANASGSTKYDWIYISLSATNLNTPNTAGDNVASLVTSRSSSASADDGTPPTYGYCLAVVTVANGFTTITNGTIADKRAQVILSTGASNPAGGWTATSTPTTITALGNRSYTVLFPAVDLTGTVSNGMRLKFTRTVTAPTQCTSLNGTTQYYTKSSPAGMTFTDDFTVSAWIKISSYAASTIMSRRNATDGWDFTVQSTGQIRLSGNNGGAGNASYVQSYQSIPLNKWVHVAAQLDMSTFTATTTTSYVMIDGVDVPAAVTRAGTNPTLLVQAGNLEIGSQNGGTFSLPGRIAQVAIYSAKVTQATVKASMSQTLAGTETSLISAYSFNNSINDLNANANNLSVGGGSAVATNADTPFAQGAGGITEYGIITANTFSTNTTLTVQVPEGSTIPTSGGVSAVSYSTQSTPYGLPAISKFKLSAWDTSGTLTNPQLLLMVQYILNYPLDNITYSNAGSAGGTMYLSCVSNQKVVMGVTASKTNNANTSSNYDVTLPTGFFTTPQTISCSIQTASGSVTGNTVLGVSLSATTLTLGFANTTASNGVGGTVGFVVTGT